MNTFGSKIKITVFGQSHAEAIGVVIDGLPAGFALDINRTQSFLERRAPGRSTLSTSRREPDSVQFVSGLYNGRTCGAPLTALIFNRDMRSGDYSELESKMRPSHSDYPANVKFGGFNDIRGGGQFSGRLTAPLCVAGDVVMQLLEEKGIYIGAHILSIADVADNSFNMCEVDKNALQAVAKKDFATIDDSVAEIMKKRITNAKNSLDSVGGIIECAVVGLPAGLGEPSFDGIENVISQSVFAVPAVKGIEFGAGFASCRMTGAQNNDAYYYDNGKVKTRTNNAGGICGGLTTGMPVVFRAAVKPTPSIAKEQETVDVASKTNTKLTVKGRHDPCIVPRAVVCIEAAAAIAVAQFVL